jgi:hypothetical protein
MSLDFCLVWFWIHVLFLSRISVVTLSLSLDLTFWFGKLLSLEVHRLDITIFEL